MTTLIPDAGEGATGEAVSVRQPIQQKVGHGLRSVDVERDDGVLVPKLSMEGKDAAGRIDDLKSAGAQRRILVAHTDRSPVEIEQIRVPLLFLLPGKGATAIRIIGPGHADLITVVDTGRAGHGHLEEGAQAQRAIVAVHSPERARGVVAVHEVQLGRHHLPFVERQHALDRAGELGRGQFGECKSARLIVGSQGLTAKETEGRTVEDVVHDGVKAIALKPVLGLMPDLADDVGVGIGFLDHEPEILPEGHVIDLLGDVQPPAVGAELDPVFGHVEQIVAYARIVDVKFGQGRNVPPGGIVVGIVLIVDVGAQRPILDEKPVKVGRVAALFQDVVKGPEATAGVVEDAVDDDVHVARMGGIKQRPKGLIAARATGRWSCSRRCDSDGWRRM